MNKSDVVLAAKAAATLVVSDLREHVGELVHQKLAVLAPPELTESTSEPVRWPRMYLDSSPPKPPASNYTRMMQQRVEWQKGKGEQIAIAWLFKPNSPLKLLVEQYGVDSPQCAILQKDASQPKSKYVSGMVVNVGASPWVDFKVIDGTLDSVVARLKAKGWVLQPTKPDTPTQMALAVGAGKEVTA